jgi:hypothetical protein
MWAVDSPLSITILRPIWSSPMRPRVSPEKDAERLPRVGCGQSGALGSQTESNEQLPSGENDLVNGNRRERGFRTYQMRTRHGSNSKNVAIPFGLCPSPKENNSSGGSGPPRSVCGRFRSDAHHHIRQLTRSIRGDSIEAGPRGVVTRSSGFRIRPYGRGS